MQPDPASGKDLPARKFAQAAPIAISGLEQFLFGRLCAPVPLWMIPAHFYVIILAKQRMRSYN